ncbi:serine/threonine kinase [Aureococcus anophagefferens]|nr:serine/threonine kinase [Aureococcus anophagefferens]
MKQNVMTKAKIVIAAYQIACSIRGRSRKASYWVLFTLYVAVPSTSSYCLRYFACASGGYGGGVNVLRIDPTISCDSPSYEAWLPYVLFSILAYPVGVPLGFACLLWRLRRRLNPDVRPQTVRTPSGRTIGEAGAHAANQEDEDFLHEALERHAESMVQFQKLEARANDPALESMRFLYEEFKPSCFMFMVYEIAIGLLGSLISYRVFSHYEPYVEEDDGVVSEVAQTARLVFFYAMMVFATDNLGQHDGVFSGKVFASLLVVLLASASGRGLADHRGQL